MNKKITIMLVFLISLISVNAATLILATGGTAIPSTTVGGTYTNLTGPVLTESASAEIGNGTIILTAPAGFEFDTSATVTILVTRASGGGPSARNINNVATSGTFSPDSITTSQITLTITDTSDPSGPTPAVLNILTFQNIGVRPTVALPLASGNITLSGTSTITGISIGAELGELIETGVPDTTPPNITILGDNPETIEAGTSYVDAGATANDDADGDITTNILTTNPVNTNAVDIYSVTYDVNDSSGNPAAQANRTVIVQDTTAPVITLLGSDPESVTLGDTYTDAGATALDSFEGDLSASINTLNPADTNTLGTYLITYDVNDSSGNNATQVNRTVNVIAAPDTTPPAITLNGSNPLYIELGLGSGYTESGATALDNVDGDISANINIDTSQVSAGTLGIYFVYYDVNDSSGNSATQVNRTVIVQDTTAPVITLNGSDPTTVEVGSVYSDDGATALDDVDGDLTASIITDTSAINTNTIGTYQVTYDVADNSNNSAIQVTRTVDVVDTTAPVITLLGNDPETVEAGTSYTDAGATASDNYDGDLTAFININDNVDTNTLGSYNVTYDLFDTSGNPAIQIVRIVNVVDTTAPIITLNGSDPVTIEAGSVYTDDGATASDNYDGDLTGAISTVNDVDSNTIGIYNVTYDLNDSSGNAAAQVVRTVNVVDTTAPAIVGMPTDMTVEATSGAGAAAVYTDPTATDAVDSSPVVSCTPASASTFPIGATIVNCTASDVSGNNASETFTVTVQDTTTPFIFVTGSSTVAVEAGTTYTDAGATAVDNVNGNVTANIVTVNPVNTSVLGNYTVTYDVNDSSGNNATQATRTVNVVDTTAPAITLNGSSTINLNVGATYTELGASANDSFEGNLSSSIVISGDVNTSVQGTYNVTYSVTDSSGNNANTTRTVNVVTPAQISSGGGGGGGGRRVPSLSSSIIRPQSTPATSSTPPAPAPQPSPAPAPTPQPIPPVTLPTIEPAFLPPSTLTPPTPFIPQATGVFNLGGREVTAFQLGVAVLALIGIAGLGAFAYRKYR